jgi:predicted permease
MENILSYAASAVQAMSQFALFCIVGLIIGEYPRPHGLLHEQAMSSGTALVFWIFTPCLLLSTFGAKLTPAILQDTIGIILWSLIHCIIN